MRKTLAIILLSSLLFDSNLAVDLEGSSEDIEDGFYFEASAFVSKAAWGAIESIKDLVHTILHYSKKLNRLIHSSSDENTSLKKM